MNELLNCVIFKGLTEEEVKTLLLEKSIIKKYLKNTPIAQMNTKASHIGVILSGGANIIVDDYWGNRNIVSNISKLETFMESFALLSIDEIPVEIIANENTEVLFIDYKKIIEEGKNKSEIIFLNNLMTLIAKKNMILTQKIFLLNQRSSRNRILAYLSQTSIKTKSDYFKIPFNRQELADYLSLDRSALSKELGKMRDEGLLEFNKSTFKLQK